MQLHKQGSWNRILNQAARIQSSGWGQGGKTLKEMAYWSVTVGGQTGQREPGAQGTLGWGLGSGAAATDRKTTAH